MVSASRALYFDLLRVMGAAQGFALHRTGSPKAVLLMNSADCQRVVSFCFIFALFCVMNSLSTEINYVVIFHTTEILPLVS